MDKKRVMIRMTGEGKKVVEVEPEIKFEEIVPNIRVALRSGSYAIHKILPDKIDPMVSSNLNFKVFYIKIFFLLP